MSSEEIRETQTRIAAKVKIVDGPLEGSPCWIWLGSTNGDGYGQFQLAGRRRYTHRAALESRLGRRLGRFEQALHRCHVTLCCRPDHLRPGSQKENNHDRQIRGTARWLDETEIAILFFAGWSVRAISRRLECSSGSITKALKRLNLGGFTKKTGPRVERSVNV